MRSGDGLLACRPVGQILPVDVLLHDVHVVAVLLHVVHHNQSRMLEPSCRAGLLQEGVQVRRGRESFAAGYFECHVALQLGIVGQEHAAKATLAQLAQDLVAANHVGDR